MLSESVNALIAVIRNPNSTADQANSATQVFYQKAARASKADIESAMQAISQHLEVENPARSAFLALVCGGLVENGADPMIVAEPIIAALKPLFISAAELADACQQRMPAAKDDEDPHEIFEKTRAEVETSKPNLKMAWEVLRQYWRPGIAVFSRSPKARQMAKVLQEPAGKISQYHEGGHWISLMLTVLDHEPFVAIEPATSLGIMGHFSGIVDNFQLNTLLMDAFPYRSFFTTRRVSRQAAEIARGRGPQQTAEILTSVWNLYNWQAIQPDLTLPPVTDNYDSSKFWIWNEGVPADIAVFEGRRVILLGPPSYPRSWRSQRMFDGLPASLECEHKLTKDEVNDWLQRLAAANQTN